MNIFPLITIIFICGRVKYVNYKHKNNHNQNKIKMALPQTKTYLGLLKRTIERMEEDPVFVGQLMDLLEGNETVLRRTIKRVDELENEVKRIKYVESIDEDEESYRTPTVNKNTIIPRNLVYEYSSDSDISETEEENMSCGSQTPRIIQNNQ